MTEQPMHCHVCGLRHRYGGAAMECLTALKQQNMRQRLYLEQRMNRLLAETHAIGQSRGCDGCMEASEIWELLGNPVPVECACLPGDLCTCADACDCRERNDHIWKDDVGWRNIEGLQETRRDTEVYE